MRVPGKSLYFALSLLIASNSIAQSNDEILASYSLEYCNCGLGKEVRRAKDHPLNASDLKSVTRCTECDLLAKMDEPSRKVFSANSPKDSDSEEALGKRLREFVNMYKLQLAPLLNDALSRTARGRNYGREWYDSCFVSHVISATASEVISISKNFAEIDCDGFPQILKIGNHDSGEYLVAIPVGTGDFIKPKALFRVNSKQNTLSTEVLRFEWYDPYTGRSTNLAMLGPTGSVWSWDSKREMLSTSAVDSEAACYEFSSEYSLAKGSTLRLERSEWHYTCSTATSSPELCPVVVYDRTSDLKGNLVKGKPGCEQENAERSPWQREFLK